MRLYQDVHQSIIDVIAHFGTRLARFADLPCSWGSPSPQKPVGEPFLCFQRRTDDDLICAGYKVVGSAQRRSAGVLLQHGSVLLQVSAGAPELPGIVNLTNADFDFERFSQVLANLLAAKIEVDRFEQGPLPIDSETIRKICLERFEAQNWTRRRN
jgi:lipoate-protein ligase A